MRVALEIVIGTSLDDPDPIRLRFDGVVDLRLEDLGVHGSVSLSIADITDRQLDGLRYSVTNDGCGMGELSFLCANARVATPAD